MAEVKNKIETAEFEQALNAFLIFINDLRRQRGAWGAGEKLGLATGKKYVRISIVSPVSESVFCFVERSTGNVLKAESWRAPAKGVRGNIYGDPSGYGIDAWGALYLR